MLGGSADLVGGVVGGAGEGSSIPGPLCLEPGAEGRDGDGAGDGGGRSCAACGGGSVGAGVWGSGGISILRGCARAAGASGWVKAGGAGGGASGVSPGLGGSTHGRDDCAKAPSATKKLAIAVLSIPARHANCLVFTRTHPWDLEADKKRLQVPQSSSYEILFQICRKLCSPQEEATHLSLATSGRMHGASTRPPPRTQLALQPTTGFNKGCASAPSRNV